MKLIRTILNQQPRVASILTGILLLWVTIGMATQYSSAWDVWDDADVSQEQAVPADDHHDQKTTTTLSSFNEAVLPIVKIQILFFCNFFQELELIEEDAAVTVKDTPLPQSRFFLTLFRQIISPNAP
uniref:Uncharacterized protein n=1 Tax=Roseihalotalea indica TaxID=2867963 RepID=A0AA49JEN0_9BACT|nr:hypothetical protein K4G66_06330 [Tunicatimonas sp. TK19036]